METTVPSPEQQIQEYLAVLEAHPDNREAYGALESLFARLERWDALLKLYEREARRLVDGPARAEVYFAMGKLWDERIGNKQQAMKHYQLAFRADPRCSAALGAARRIYRDLGNWKMVARLLELQIEADHEPEGRADLLCALGQVYLNELGDARRSSECFEAALALVPEHQVAAEALESLRSARANWREVVEEMQAAAETATEPELQESLYLRIAGLFHREDRGAPEVEHYVRRALAARPDSQHANELLAQALEEQGRLEELSQHLNQWAEATAELRYRSDLYCRLARIAWHNLGDEEGAIADYRKVLEIEPQNPEALSAVVQGLRRRREHEGLFALATHALGSELSPDLRVRLLREVGEVAWREVGDRKRAARYLQELRTLSPNEPLCLEFFRQAEAEPQDAKTHYEQLARSVRYEGDTGKRREMYRTMARLAEEALQSPKDAIDAWRSVLELDRTDAEARERLKALYRRAERWHALVELLKSQVEQLPPELVEEKVALYEEMAEVYGTRLQMEPMVVNTLNAALHVAPKHRVTLDRLATIYERRQSWGQLADVLARKADASEDPREKLGLLHRSAEIWLNRLQSPEDAIKRYEEILSLDPLDARALQALRKVYEQRRAYEPLVQVYLREIDILPDNEAKAARAREVAEWAQKHLHRPARLIELWNKVLQFDERDPKALAALSSLYERDERWEALAEVLNRQINDTQDKRARVLHMRRLGQIYADRIGREDLAVSLWEEALNLDPENADVFKILRDRYVRAHQFEALEQLYARRGRWEEYVDVLVVQAESSAEPAQKCEVYFQIADVWQGRLQRPDRAARVYERVLEIEPHSLRAAVALQPFYEQHGEWRKLSQVEEILAEATTNPEERAGRWRNLAQLYEERLRRTDLAFGCAARALVDDPSAPDAIANLQRLAEAQGTWAELAATLQAARARSDQPARRQELAWLAARYYDDKLGRVEEAIAAYEVLRGEDPVHAGALEALARLYRKTERRAELRGILRAKLSTIEEAQVRRELWFEVAGLEERLGSVADAIESYRAVLLCEEDDPQALAALARLYEATSQPQALAEVLARALARATSAEERARLLEQLGRLAMGPLQDPASAVAHFRRLLETLPDHPAAFSALEELLTPAESRKAAAQILVERYRGQGAWEHSLGAYEVLVVETEEPSARVELLLEMGRIAEQQLRRHEQAFTAFCRAFREDPGDPRTFAEMDRLATLLDREPEVADLLAAEIGRIERHEYRAQLTLRAAVLFTELERPADAVRTYEEALSLGLPDDEARRALRTLAQIHERSQAWPELNATLRRSLDFAESGTERKNLLLRLAGLLADQLGQPSEAAQAYREVLALDPDDEEALGRLDHLYADAAEWTRLADVLAARIRMARGAGEGVALRSRLGHLLADRLERATEALVEFRAVLEIDPDNDEAVAAIEALVRQDPDLQVLAAETLAPAYERRGDLEKVSAALETLLPARPPAERVEILHRVAFMAEEGGGLERAFEAYRRALHEVPPHRDTRLHLGRLADRMGRWPELLAELEKLLPEITASDELALALCDMAEAAEERLSDPERAIGYYRQVLELDRGSAPATTGLERLYPTVGRWRDLALLLEARLTEAADPVLARELALRIGRLQEVELSDSQAAVAAYRQAQALFPDDPEVLDSLERLYLRDGRFEDLVDLYLHRAKLAESLESRKELLFTVAEILEEKLRDLQRAVEIYRRVADADPQDMLALRALARLHEALGDPESLLGVLTSLAEISPEPFARLQLRYRQGELWQGPLGNPEHAVEIYRAILAEAPDHAPAVAALETLLSSPQRLLAARVLSPLYAERGDWAKYAGAAEIELQETEEPAQKVALLHRIAQVRELRLGDKAGAFAAYRQALRALPQDEVTLVEVERLAIEEDRYADLAQIYEETLADLAEPALARRLALKVARLYDEVLGDSEGAVEKYKRVLAYAPDDTQALRALDHLYGRSGRYSDLAQTLRREVELAEGREEKVALRCRLGEILDAHLEDASGAVRAFQGALEVDPGYAPAVEALEGMLARGREVPAVGALLDPLYRSEGQWAKLVRLLEIETEAMPAPTERKRTLREIAQIHEERLSAPDLAFAFLARALREDATDEETLATLTRLADLTASWDELAALLDDEEERAQDDAVREALALRAATIYGNYLRQPAVAAERYRRVVERNPRCVPALRALDRLYSEAGAWRELAGILRLEAESAPGPSEEIDYLARLAAVQESRLGDLPAAVGIYREILVRDPRQPGAIGALLRIFEETDQPEELYRVHERRLALCESDPERVPIHAAMAELAGERLGRPDEAIELWNTVLQIAGESDQALAALEQLYEATERFGDLCEVLARRAAIASDPTHRAVLLARRGHVYGEVLGRDELAVESWKGVLEARPGDLAALTALRQLYRRGRHFNELCEVLQVTAAVTAREGGDPAALIALYAELGQVQGEALLHPAAAVEAWNRVLELDPRHRGALSALEKLYAEEGAWRECVEVLERRAAGADTDEESLDAMRRAADVYDRHLHLPDRATEIYERILETGRAGPEAEEALEGLYERLGNFERLAERLLARLEAVEGSWERLALLRRIADIYLEHQNRPDLAFYALCRAVVEDPRDPQLLAQAERLARETGNFEELVAVFEDLLGKVTDRELLCALHATLARYYGEELGQPDYAVAHYRRILALDDENREALTSLETVLRRESRLPELADVLRRKAELAVDLREKKDYLFDLATLREKSLGNLLEAAQALQDIVRLDERDEVALEALARIYRQTGSWRDLIEVLRRKIELADEQEEELALRQQIAEIYDRELRDGGRAAEVYREILALDPGRADARDDLERIFTLQRRWDDLTALLSQQIPFAHGPAEEIALHEKIAALWEENLGHPERAIDSYRAILILEPRHLDALEALERIYEAQERWRDLADVLERHASVEQTPEKAVRYLQRLGNVYQQRLGDRDQAAGAYRRVLEVDPDDVEALSALAVILEASGDYRTCADTLERAARIGHDRRRAATAWHKVATLAVDRLNDPERAQGALRYAIGADPSYLPAVNALKELYAKSGDWKRTLDLLQHEEEQTQDLQRRVELLCETGRVQAEKLGDTLAAAQYYEMALEKMPNYALAARPLADLYFERGEPEKARTLLEVVVQKAAAAGIEPYELARYRHRLAVVTEKAGDEAAALRHYHAAYEADMTYLPTLLALGDLLYRRAEWAEAFKVYQSLVVHHSDSKELDLVEVYHRLGVVRHRLGERRKAVHSFDKALEIDPRHVATLRALSQVHEETGEWDEVAAVRKKLVEALTQPEEKLEAAISIGDLYHEKLKNPAKAVDAYLDALDQSPSNLQVLHKLLELYTEGRQWRRAIELLEQIASLETDPQNVATYYYSMAVIYRDELKEVDPAIDYFNKTLDSNVMRLKAFEGIDKLLTQKRDWSALAANYRRMIERLPEGAPRDLRVMLYKNLGEVYRTRLRSFDEATTWFKEASALMPEDGTLHSILAELYEENEATLADAGREHMQLLLANPARPASYHALYRVCRKAGDHDRAYRLCHTLKYLKQIDPGEEQYLERLRAAAPKRPQRPLDERMWQAILHPTQNRILGMAFAFLTSPVAEVYLSRPKDLGVRPKDRVDTSDLQIFFSKIFQLCRGVLGVAPPEAYIKSEGHLGLTLMNTAPVTLLVGPDMAQDRPEPELAFALAKHLSYLRPEHFLSALLPPLVETIFYAGVRACFPTQKLPDSVDRREIEDLQKRIEKKLPPAGLAQLRSLYQQFYQANPRFDPAAWLASIEYTADRAGFLLSHDLSAAERILQQEPVAISQLARADKIKDLLLFSISDEYFALRKALGMAVQV